MKRRALIILIIVLGVLGGLAFWWERSLAPAPQDKPFPQEEARNSSEGEIGGFRECVKAGNPVMESYPRQCRSRDSKTFTEEACTYPEEGGILTLADAREIAEQSECGDRLTGEYFCNENSGTWWLDLDIDKEGCNPACVVDVVTREAEINWRCTGLIEPEK